MFFVFCLVEIMSMIYCIRFTIVVAAAAAAVFLFSLIIFTSSIHQWITSPKPLYIHSDFTVNAMDVEELRRSQRRHRKARPERPTDIPLMSVSGSQDSDDDDEVMCSRAEGCLLLQSK